MKENTNSNSENKTKSGFVQKKSSWSNYLSRTSVAIIFLSLGIGGTLLAQNLINNKKSPEEKLFNDFFYNPFRANNIFAEMHQIEKRMDEVFEAHKKQMDKAFDGAQKNNTSLNKSSVLTKEDADGYIYELSFSGFSKDEVNAEIKDNILTFWGEKKKEGASDKQKSSASSSFYYSFSLPKYDNKKNPEIVKDDSKITVKIFKKASKK